MDNTAQTLTLSSNEEASKKVVNVVQFILHTEDLDYNKWYDICIDMLPPEKATALSKMIGMFNRVGDDKDTHIVCAPTEYGKENGLTKTEVAEIRSFDLSDYAEYAPPVNVPCVITGRFILHYF